MVACTGQRLPPASTDSSMTTSSPSRNAVFDRWKSARISFALAIDELLSASTGVCEMMSTPTNSHELFQHVLPLINSELDSLKSDNQRLEQNYAALTQARNTSRMFVTFNRIPPEVITKIFVFACARYTGNDRTRWNPWNQNHVSPVVLSAVCSSWRLLALQTPSIWSEIDVVVGAWDGFKSPRLWAERSRNSPLSLTMCEHSSVVTIQELRESRTSELVEFLAPLMPRVRAIEFKLSHYTHTLNPMIIKCWAQGSSPGIDKTLKISAYMDDYGPYMLDTWTPRTEFNNFFQDVTRLTLRSCTFSKGVIMPHGLVDLHIEDLPRIRGFGSERLAAVLAQCPNLRSFAFVNCAMSEMPKASSPVTLKHLRVLCLESTKSSHVFHLVLPILNVESNELDMSLTLSDNQKFVSAAHSFFGRTKVKRLYARNIENRASLKAILCPIPSLAELVVEQSLIWVEVHQFIEDPEYNGHAWWPSLHTLYLNSCWAEPNTISSLVGPHTALKRMYLSKSKHQDDSEWTYQETRKSGESLSAWRNIIVQYDVDPLVHWAVVVLK